MNDYVQLRIDAAPCSPDLTDILAALLADIDYESFLPDEKGLTAFVAAKNFDLAAIEGILPQCPIPADFEVSHTLVEGRDWNAEWERHYFQPILIAGRCAVHSSFHTDIPRADIDIVIDPKMAFGTGHHSTTSLVASALLATPPAGLNVVDMGTGTGILAILAEKLGAARIDAIEIDEFAYANTVENLRDNGALRVRPILGDASSLDGITDVDLFVANINRNIILADIKAYAATMRRGAVMLLSGFYAADVPVLLDAAAPLGLEFAGSETAPDSWTCLRLRKS